MGLIWKLCHLCLELSQNTANIWKIFIFFKIKYVQLSFNFNSTNLLSSKISVSHINQVNNIQKQKNMLGLYLAPSPLQKQNNKIYHIYINSRLSK